MFLHTPIASNRFERFTAAAKREKFNDEVGRKVRGEFVAAAKRNSKIPEYPALKSGSRADRLRGV